MPRLVNGLEQIFTDLGIVGDGYKLFFFEYDTTTPKDTYSDQNLTIPNTNPVVCDASGRPTSDVWGSDPSLYKMILGTPNSTIDNIDAVVTLNPVDDLNNDSILSITPMPTAYWGATTGTSSNYVLNPALVGITSYNNQQCFFLDIHVVCAAGCAIDINGIGSRTFKKYTQQGTKVNLIAGDLQVQRHLFINDGVDIVCLNPTTLYTPIGSILTWTQNTPPGGYLECNGSAISRTTYSALFSVIGTTFGVGDGSTTFNIPDMRGYFIRGWSNGASIDSGRAFASTQQDAFQGHRHVPLSPQSSFYGQPAGGLNASGGAALTAVTTTGDPTTDTTNGVPRTASETRPINIALMYCIKY